ncbi:MAG TPA: FAD-dependent oxidoreductase [Flavobacterium sp.]
MELSYWELKNWFTGVDHTVVGSGIVGLHTALRLRERFPSAKILVLEKGVLPQGASTKNAGFACFGSLSEILEDLKSHSPEEVVGLVRKRWHGLQLLRSRIGDSAMDLKMYGGYELFPVGDTEVFEECKAGMREVNELLRPVFNEDVFRMQDDSFGFGGINGKIFYNPFEAQVDTGNLMQVLLKQAVANDILILNRQTVKSFSETDSGVEVFLESTSFHTKKLLITTNGFAAQLIPADVRPARAQVVITKPIPGLKIKGTFHLDKGYYYFRNIGDRILFGGGRNLDILGETTHEFGQTHLIQERLLKLLKDVILPERDFEIEHRWSGIMGMGLQKNPIVKQLSQHVYCGVRLGGMGVAIGSIVGKETADLI